MQDLKSLKEAALSATQGPWATDDPWIVYAKKGNEVVYLAKTSELDTSADQYLKDASYIAAMSPDVALSLIAELEQLRAEKAKEMDEAIFRQEKIKISGLMNQIHAGEITIEELWDGFKKQHEPRKLVDDALSKVSELGTVGAMKWLAAASAKPVEQEPVAWMRKWKADGEVPHKVKGRWISKFKILPITPTKLFSDDVALYASPQAPVAAVQASQNSAPNKVLVDALQKALAVIDDYLAYTHNGDPWVEDARLMGEMDINDYESDGRRAKAVAALKAAGVEVDHG